MSVKINITKGEDIIFHLEYLNGLLQKSTFTHPYSNYNVTYYCKNGIKHGEFIIKKYNDSMVIIYEEGKVVDSYYLINGRKIYKKIEEAVDDKMINTIKRNLIDFVCKYRMDNIKVETNTYEGTLTPELYFELTR